MDDGAPTLEVGFAIDTGDSYAGLQQLSELMSSTEMRIVAEAQKIERATAGMLDLGGAKASLISFGNAAEKEYQSAAREAAKAEKAGEALSRQLDRQAAAFGKTKEQMRQMRVETAAVAAEQQGLTELAGRLRSQEASLYAQEFAAARRTRAEVEAVAQAKDAEAAQAVAAADREAQAVRSAAVAYQMFNAVAKQKMAAYNEQQAAQAAAGAEREAQAVRSATVAYQMFNAVAKQKMGAYNDQQAAQLQREATAAKAAADEHARLAAIVRGSHDAQEADAAAAERLRESTDAVYAATKRLNAQIAESTRLYHAGATAPAEYARQQAVLNTELVAETNVLGGATRGHQSHLAAAGLSRNAQMELTHVIKASAEQMAMGAPPLTILTTHLGQLGQIASMTEGGVWGLTKALGGLVASVLRVVAPFAVAAAVGFAAFKQFQSQVKDSGELTRYRDSLGLTHKEMLQLSDGVDKAGDKIKKLDDVTITAGDAMAGLWKAVKDNASGGGDVWDKLKSGAVTAFGYVLEAWNITSAGITASIYGTFNAVKVVWDRFPAVFGDLFVSGVNVAIGALNKLVEAGVGLLNGFIATANKVPGINLGQISAPKIAPLDNANAGAAASAAKAIGDGYSHAYADAKKADASFWHQVGNNAKQHAKDRMKEEADALKENRTPKAPKAKVDHNALDAEAVEAQIRNLYKLADAYGVSGAAALIAAAREKAESQAIKARVDIEAAVERQIRLAIAERVRDAAKATAAVVEQASAQARVNELVEAGLVPASRASEMVKDQIADLPLLAALQAAQQIKDKIAIDAATAALKAQRTARAALADQESHAQFLASKAAGDDRLAEMQKELELIGATDAARTHALATLKATQDAEKFRAPEDRSLYIAQQVRISDLEAQRQLRADAFNASLHYQSDLLDILATNAQKAGQGMADAFGSAGQALGDLASRFAGYVADQHRLQDAKKAELLQASQIEKASLRGQEIQRITTLYAARSAGQQVGLYGDMAQAAKGFFKEGSAGYDALAAAEKAFRIVQFAMSVQAMIQNAAETLGFVTNAAARATADGTAGIAAQSKLPFPLNIVAMAATGAALIAAGIAIFGGGGSGAAAAPVSNTGTGTVLGDPSAKSDSIKRSIDALKEVDTLMLSSSRQMAASLKSIESQIGGVAAQIVKGGAAATGAPVTEGFKPNLIGSVLGAIPLIGGFLSSLFGSKSEVTASGIYGGAQSVGSIVNGGFNAQTYSDVTKTSKFFGITTGHSYSTQYGALDASLQNQFTLILKSFDDAITAAAGPLGVATGEIESRLNGFVVNIGKIDLKGLTGAEIQDKLTAVFGAAADSMANAAFPGIAQFQKVGEGAFETLVRVSSTVEAVSGSLDQLGQSAQGMSIAVKLGLADQFDSVSSLTSAADAYFQAFYTKEEQAAAKTAQFGKVFDSLGLAMPATLAGFRQLVEAQDLTSTAGQATYATLLKLAPAFADLQSAMEGAKSAADIASERQDLERQLLELRGDTAAIRALDLAKLDASNRALQTEVWAVQDAQAAAKAADDLRQAWVSVGDSIVAEVNRIRGLSDTATGGGFASLQGQFNAANTAARGGDQDAAKSLPGLSQALLTAAALVATSRQELDRIQAQTAAALEKTNLAITGLSAVTSAATPVTSATDMLAAAAASQAASTPIAANDDLRTEIQGLREELAGMRADNNTANATIAGNTARAKTILENVTQGSGGDAIATVAAA